MNLSLKTCYFINDVMFENLDTHDNVLYILDAPYESKNIEPSTKLIKGLRDFLIEIDNDNALADMLHACFNNHLTQISHQLNQYKHQFTVDILHPSEIITRRYNQLIELFEKDEAFHLVLNTKTLESLINIISPNA